MAELTSDPTIEVDEFAQTRGADDLFDDEIIPITGDQEVQVHQQVDEPPIAEQEQQLTEPTPAQQPAPTARRARGHGRGSAHTDGGRGRGRGRGRGGGGGGRGGSDTGPKKEPAPKEDSIEVEAKDIGSDEPQDEEAGDEKREDETEAKTAAKGENARVQAVRGDRSGTGGVKKPKLTEEELAERMAAAKLNSAKKAAAHARAEADEASFQERERVAAVKRRQELVNRKAMDNERERNRMRKLGAQTGREWDAEKKEEDYNGRRGGGSQYRRGMHGAVAGLPRHEQNDNPEFFEDIPPSRGHSRGRGGRGGIGRGSRGDFSNLADRPTPQVAPGINNESEFPVLPGNPNAAAAPTEGSSSGEKPQSPAVERVLSPGGSLSPAEGTWAEQVESNEAR